MEGLSIKPEDQWRYKCAIIVAEPPAYSSRKLGKRDVLKGKVFHELPLLHQDAVYLAYHAIGRFRYNYPILIYNFGMVHGSHRLPDPLFRITGEDFDALMKHFDEQDAAQ